MGLLLPGVLLQDAWRFAFFARGRGRSALTNDLIAAMVMLPAFAVALRVPSDGAIAAFMLAWGGATAFAAAAGCVQAGTIPSLSTIGRWWRDHRDIAPRYLLEFTAQSGAGQIGLTLVGVVAGLVALAAIRAGQLLLGVPNVLFQGLELVIMPEAVRLARRSTRSLVTFVRLVALAEASAAVACGVALLLIPRDLGVGLLGPNWHGARSIFIPLTLSSEERTSELQSPEGNSPAGASPPQPPWGWPYGGSSSGGASRRRVWPWPGRPPNR
jgi:hypothetical protein